MVDAERVVSYEDMLNVIMQPEKVIIDVRNPDEIIATGKIPSSINVPSGGRRSGQLSLEGGVAHEECCDEFYRDCG
ncbi:hypothetical protein EVAR_32644_1 [Eumeta japonica]|uniref:Rhodanese domain-containing protein n=1 Tax=Eumeta variegata TaxID=151549 RepID=A0A4C1WW00_EUMVA|nr:hypothetical protein EVAR_32644_1 [Eumeta japonica]